MRTPAMPVLAALLALAACGREPPPVTAAAPLTRPVHALAAAPNEVQIPTAALTERGGIPGVFVLDGGEARFRMVRPGRRAGDRVAILSGLRGDETLVLGDLKDVRDGTPIKRPSAIGSRQSVESNLPLADR
jgi:hypothetical protein